MAKKKLDKAIDKNKLDLFETLYALDTRNKEYYANLPDDMKKKYAPVVLMRFMSAAQNQDGKHEYHITTVNSVVNQDFWTLAKHPELQHKLLATCGLGEKQYHSWIPMAKGNKSDKLSMFFQEVYPNMNNLEFETLIKLYDTEDFRELALSHALEDKEIDTLVQQFENVKYGKKQVE